MFKDIKVIDVHSHMSTPSEFGGYVSYIVSSNSVSPFWGPSDEEMEEALAEHLAVIDDRKVDFQLIGPRPVNMWHWLRPFLQEAWCKATNDVIAQSVKLHPDRFAGMAQLPQNAFVDTSNCVAELERCVKEMEFVGAYLNPDPSGTKEAPGLAEPYWHPLFEKAQELDVPLMVHPSLSKDPRIEKIPENYQINNVTEEYIATMTLQHTDVFVKFPDLRICVCHCGGALQRFIREDTLIVSQKDLSNNLFFDLCAYERDFIETAIRQRGVSQLCFGTESPGAGMFSTRKETGRPSDDLIPVIDDISFLSEQDKLDIFRNNPLKVFTKVAAIPGV